MQRRDFLLAATAALAAGRNATAARLPIRKGILISMLPKELPLEDRLKLARDVGFDDLECHTVTDLKEAEAIRAAADKAKLRIHSVMNSAHWQSPLNSPDPAVVAKGMEGMQTSLRNAHFWGADTVLLVPAVVSPKFSYYQDAWTRSQAQIRKLLPLAEEFKVVIAIEEVWNKFLLSPIEFARYVDEFQSPWVQAYLDVGNMAFYGYPQDWIRTLGKRTAKVHFKDFRFRNRTTEFTPLREGDIDWMEVHKAFAETGYSGTATVELPGGDEKYLREVSRRVDLILSGAQS
jgi:L-ribulose-5-phosphate 3-epimerase